MAEQKKSPKAKPEAKAEAKPKAKAAETKHETSPPQERNELKVVIACKNGRVMLGVQSPSCDPVYKTMDGSLEKALEHVPALVAEAKRKWNESPLNPKAEMPEPPPSEKPTPVAASSSPRSKAKTADDEHQQMMF